MKVPFVDLQLRGAAERAELLTRIAVVIDRGSLVLTDEVARLEKAVQTYTGAKHCIGLNSGTDALIFALKACGIGPGDEVIVPPVSFVATVAAVAHVGAKPVFCDVGPDQLIDPSQIARHVTTRTRAVMPVHWTGRICDMAAIGAIAERHGLTVVEDSCQSMGAFHGGKHGGTFGKAGAISCHPLKNMGALGDAGLLLTNDDGVAEFARLYRNHGLASRDNVVMWGVNSRLDSLQAEVLRYRLERLDEVIAKRTANADTYRRLIRASQVTIPEGRPGARDPYVMFLVLAERRDELKASLAEHGIETLVYYATPLHLHAAAKPLGYGRGDFPQAERQCNMVLALPHHQHLTVDQMHHVAEHINRFYGA
jgi:dTDP-4-amino-4,6-dideoxygalactose transaminase